MKIGFHVGLLCLVLFGGSLPGSSSDLKEVAEHNDNAIKLIDQLEDEVDRQYRERKAAIKTLRVSFGDNVPSGPDTPEDPPTPTSGYAEALKKVEQNFADLNEGETYRRQKAVLFAVLVPGTADTPAGLWAQTQKTLEQDEVLNGNAPQWEPWLVVLTDAIETAEDLTVEKYTKLLAEARASLKG